MAEETLDIENHDALASYLRARDSSLEPVQMKTLAGGVSNRTVLVGFADGRAWVIKQALAKLRTKADWFSDPARVHREALGMRWLAKLAPPGTIPEFVFEDFEHHLLAMEAVSEPHENWKTMLLAKKTEPDQFVQFGQLLGAIHRNSMANAAELAKVFDDRSFFESLRIAPYYLYTATQVPEAAEFLRGLVEATRSHRFALVHGDFSPKNILVQNGKLVLLDHEVIHWGDPAFDLGFALTHLISKVRHLEQETSAFVGTLNFWTAYSDSCGDWLRPPLAEMHINCHLLACMLARVAGRSPLEYLSDSSRAAHQRLAIGWMRKVPRVVAVLIAALMAPGEFLHED